MLITLGIVFGDIFYVVFLSIIVHYVIDCVLTLISQSEDNLVILQDESRI